MCPECGEPLVAFELGGVEIDRCIACGGTWLDEGEIELIAKLAGVEHGDLREALEAHRGKPGKRRCPRCRGKLLAAPVGKEQPLEIELCPNEHGLWLDRGEMESVIKCFHAGEEGAVAQFFSELYRSAIDTEKGG
jgi:Zn-finger nucleic acid-binding protein